MKKVILFLFTCLPAALLAQGQYVVGGTLGNYGSPAKVYLRYHTKTASFIDSVELKDGKFRFEGQLTDDPIMASLSFNGKGTGPDYGENRQVYLENGTITVTGTAHLSDAAISGSINADNQVLLEAMKSTDVFSDRLNDKRNSTPPDQQSTDQYRADMDKLVKDLINAEKAVDKKFIEDHPDSYISLVALGTLTYSSDYADIEPLYNGLSDRMKQTLRGKHFAELLPRLKAIRLGAIAPEFAEADTTGKMINLSSFRGQYVLVDFWASWCGPCRAESPNLVKAYNRYKGKNFTILGVSLDSHDGRGRWIAAINKDGLNWTQVSDLKFWDSEAAVLYGIKAIPQNFLLDPTGKIIAKNLRGYDLEAKLEEIFGKI